MVKQDELIKLDRLIKDSTIRVETFKTQIETIQKEINILASLEKELETNITYLKKNKTIALATEYKKSKEDLKKTKTRLLHLKSDKAMHEKAIIGVEDILDKNKKLYEKLSKESENNVISGKFGKKRD